MISDCFYIFFLIYWDENRSIRQSNLTLCHIIIITPNRQIRSVLFIIRSILSNQVWNIGIYELNIFDKLVNYRTFFLFLRTGRDISRDMKSIDSSFTQFLLSINCVRNKFKWVQSLNTLLMIFFKSYIQSILH